MTQSIIRASTGGPSTPTFDGVVLSSGGVTGLTTTIYTPLTLGTVLSGNSAYRLNSTTLTCLKTGFYEINFNMVGASGLTTSIAVYKNSVAIDTIILIAINATPLVGLKIFSATIGDAIEFGGYVSSSTMNVTNRQVSFRYLGI